MKITERIQVDPVTGCHNWTGAKNPKGYGRMKVGGRLLLPHRVAYEAARGSIPDGLVIDHLCRNPACCNPDHMEVVTQAENVRRGRSGARQAERTHCPQGHPYDDANTYIAPSGDRQCRTCRKARQQCTNLDSSPSGATDGPSQSDESASPAVSTPAQRRPE